MAEIKASSSEIVACGNEIIELSKQYHEQISDLFDSFTKINERAWSGLAANNYVSQLSSDRSTFEAFGDYLKYYGNAVKKIGENVEKTVNKWEDK